MDLINNKFRIVNTRYSNRIISFYDVISLGEKDILRSMYYINPKMLPDMLIKRFLSESENYQSIHHPFLVKVLDFNMVFSVDRKSVNRTNYYFIIEKFDYKKTFLGYVRKDGDADFVLSKYIDILKTFALIARKNYFYESISSETIYIDENLDIKIKDIVSDVIESNLSPALSEGSLIYKAPEIFKGERPGIHSTIYSLGVYLEKLFENKNFSLKYNEVFLPIVKKMKEYSQINRYHSLMDVVKDINKAAKTDYSILFDDKLYYTRLNPAVTGRENILQPIMHSAYALAHGDRRRYIFEIKGDFGSGKTKLLRTLRKKLSINSINIFASFTEDRSNTKNNPFIDILAKILDEKGQPFIEKYPKVVNYIKNASMKENDFAAYAQINSFIEEAIGDQPTAIIIDDISPEDKRTAEIIRYMSESANKNSALIILYSCSDTLGIENSEVMSVNSLDVQQTTEFIKDFLGMSSQPVELAMRIYKTTYGNVNDLNRIMKNLLSQDILYLSSDGDWQLDLKAYNDMFITEDNFAAVTDVFACLTGIQKEILTSFSVFKNPSPAENIYNTFSEGISSDEIKSQLDELVSYNILTTHFNDDGYYYEFQDKNLKRNIYTMLDECQKTSMHKTIADKILKSEEVKDKRTLDELVFHFKNAGDFKNAASYTVRLAREYINSSSIDDGLEKYSEALNYADLSNDSFTRLIITQRSAAAYFANGKLDKAADTYRKSIIIAENMSNHKVVLNSMNKLLELYLEQNLIAEATDLLEEIRVYFELHFKISNDDGINEKDERIYYLKGLLEYYICFAKYGIHTNDIQTTFEYSEKGLGLIGKGYKKQKGFLTYYKALASKSGYMNYSIEDMEQISNETLDIFKEINYAKGIALAYNNLGILHSERIGNNKKAIQYFSLMKNISAEHNMYSQKCIAYANLAESYFWELEHEKAYKCFKESLAIALELNKQDLIFYIYVYIAEVLIEVLDFKRARDYIEKAETELKRNPNQATSMANYNRMLALMHLNNGDILLAKEHIDKVFEASAYFSLVDGVRVKIIDAHIKLRLTSDKGEQERLRAFIFEQVKTIKGYPFALKALLDLVVIKGFLTANGFDKWLCTWGLQNFESENARMHQNLNFLRAQTYKNEKLLKIADELQYDIPVSFDKRQRLQTSFAVFKIYSSLSDPYSALNFLIECYLILKEMVYITKDSIDGKSSMGIVMKEVIQKLEEFTSQNGYASGKRNVDLQAFSYKDADARIKDNSILTNLIGDDALKTMVIRKLGINNDISSDTVMESLKFSNIKNIEILLSYMKDMTWADAAGIFTEIDGELYPLVSLEELSDINSIKRIINQVLMTEDKVFYSEFTKSDVSANKKLLQKNIKGFMCFAIYNNIEVTNDRRTSKKAAIAYVYLESRSHINNFTHSSSRTLQKFSNLLGAFIDNYNLSYKYSVDKLTGAYNRQYFDLYLKNEIDDIYVANGSFSLIIMDIDLFKKVNDTFGHTAGDQLLKQFTSIVQQTIRNEDVFCRYGGEEFTLILKNTASEEALSISNRIRKLIEKNLLDPSGKSITVSMGIASYPQHAQWEEELITKADIALYSAKNHGRNAVEIWSADIDEKKVLKTNNDELLSAIFGESMHRSNLFVKSVNMLKENMDSAEKMENYLRYMLDYFEAENLYIVSCLNKRIKKLIKVDKTEMITVKKSFKKFINTKFIRRAYEQGETIFTTDWENTSVVDEITGIPKWQSILATPIIHNGETTGVLYMTSPVKSNEFSYIDSAVAQIVAPIIGSII